MFIAEIGINHNGDIDLAKKLIFMAKECGADVVKFQKRTPELCVPEDQKNVFRETPWGKITYLEYRHKVEFGKREYDEIDAYCRELGIQWTASIWDIPSLDFITQYNIPFIKIPSACITDFELLEKIKELYIPVVLSIGMSNKEEAEAAIEFFKDNDLTILHCNSSYPSNEAELDLKTITLLKEMYPQHKIGYSGHEEGIMPSILARCLGAEVIERHITLDKSLWGSDQKASLTKDELKELIYNIKKVPLWLGKPQIHCYPSEDRVKSKLRKK